MCLCEWGEARTRRRPRGKKVNHRIIKYQRHSKNIMSVRYLKSRRLCWHLLTLVNSPSAEREFVSFGLFQSVHVPKRSTHTRRMRP